MDVTVIRTPAGGGKTTKTAQKIAQADKSWRIEVYVPTHALAVEWKSKIQEFNPACRVRVVGGRNHQPKGLKTLCHRHELAATISKAGQSVYSRLCQSSTGGQCHAYRDCKYIEQFEFAHVYIYTHAHLSRERGRLDQRVPDLVVIDESFFSACLTKVEFNISLLRHPGLPVAAVRSPSSTTNSSPPMRETVSTARTQLSSRTATSINSASPMP